MTQAKIKLLESIGVKVKIPAAIGGYVIQSLYKAENGHLMAVLGSGVEVDLGMVDGDTGAGLPTGGTTGQILAKSSDEDLEVEWIDPPTSEGSAPDIASQAEAEAGEDNTKMMTPLRTAEAIAELTPKQSKTINMYIGGTLVTGSNGFSIPAPANMTVTGIYLAVLSAPTGADLIIDINKNGTTLYTTQLNRPTISDGNTSATATLPDVTALAENDMISVDIDQVGSTVAGATLMINLKGDVS